MKGLCPDSPSRHRYVQQFLSLFDRSLLSSTLLLVVTTSGTYLLYKEIFIMSPSLRLNSPFSDKSSKAHLRTVHSGFSFQKQHFDSSRTENGAETLRCPSKTINSRLRLEMSAAELFRAISASNYRGINLTCRWNAGNPRCVFVCQSVGTNGLNRKARSGWTSRERFGKIAGTISHSAEKQREAWVRAPRGVVDK